jgi:hypothetical protein
MVQAWVRGHHTGHNNQIYLMGHQEDQHVDPQLHIVFVGGPSSFFFVSLLYTLAQIVRQDNLDNHIRQTGNVVFFVLGMGWLVCKLEEGCLGG